MLIPKLKSSGIPQAQAEAVVRVIAEAQDNLVTKDYFDHTLEKELFPIKTDLAVIKSDLIFLKWGMGVVVVSILTMVIKSFF